MKDFHVCVGFLINHSSNVLNKYLKEPYSGSLCSVAVNPPWHTRQWGMRLLGLLFL